MLSQCCPNVFLRRCMRQIMQKITFLSRISLGRRHHCCRKSTNFYCNLFLKGILHQKIFYRLNLIFWIVMGCGIARFSRRGLKTTEVWKFWSQRFPGNQMGPRGTARNDKSLKSFISGAAPGNPRCAAPQNPWGQILRPKFSSFGGF